MSGFLVAVAISACVSQTDVNQAAHETVVYRCPDTVSLIYRDPDGELSVMDYSQQLPEKDAMSVATSPEEK